MPSKRSLAACKDTKAEIDGYIADSTNKSLHAKYQHYTIQNAHLTYRGKVLVPLEEVSDVIKREYEQCYFGNPKLFQKLSAQYIGISQRNCVAFLRNNEVNQLHKIAPTLKHTEPRKLVKGPNMLWQIDITFFRSGSGRMIPGSKKIPLLGIVDCFSRKAHYAVLSDESAASVVKALEKYLTSHNKPRCIQSDNGSSFLGDFSLYLTGKTITQVFGRAYCSESQGNIERLHRTLKSGLQKYLSNGGSNWRNFIPAWLNSYNTAIHSSTGYASNILHEAPADSVIARRALKKMEKSNTRLLKKRSKFMQKFSELNIGQSVRILRNRKKTLGRASEARWSKVVDTVAKVENTKSGIQYILTNSKGVCKR
eukprot:Lithocolla_globosa_v1_NODE_2236_length_2095_cov_59.551471.p1 type:complete len:367 gc:universal NODE_2236_length_2095_cov_59.551471:908-2008(+)